MNRCPYCGNNMYRNNSRQLFLGFGSPFFGWGGWGHHGWGGWGGWGGHHGWGWGGHGWGGHGWGGHWRNED